MTESAPRVGVGCIVIRDGQILLIRRQRNHGAGTWSPPGGHLDFGETPAECAARETREESGVGVAVSDGDFLAVTSDIYTDVGRHYITIWMLGAADDSTPSVQDREEIADVGWFPLTDLPQPLFLSLEHLLSGDSLPR